jgi:hypothetical protein
MDDVDHALSVGRQCRVGQVISPSSQQIIVGANHVTISTCTSVGIRHDQHIARLFYCLIKDSIADGDIGVTRPFTILIISAFEFRWL